MDQAEVTEMVHIALSEVARRNGQKGGLTRAKLLSPEKRSEIARKAGLASGIARKWTPPPLPSKVDPKLLNELPDAR